MRQFSFRSCLQVLLVVDLKPNGAVTVASWTTRNATARAIQQSAWYLV